MGDRFISRVKDKPGVREKSLNTASLNRIFFSAGLVGLPICIVGWQRWGHFAWLIGIGLFSYFVVSSITDAIQRTRKDLREHKERVAVSHSGETNVQVLAKATLARKPLRSNPYFRAGIMGLPFCVFEWFWKHEPVFLLGGGFFVGILVPLLYRQWRQQQSQEQTKKDGLPEGK